jgi:hypothetical protein
VEWTPVFDRGDGTWVGIDHDGNIAVGSRSHIKAKVAEAGHVPLWPLLEREFHTTYAELCHKWSSLDPGRASSPERLIEAVIGSAVDAGSPYWVERALQWISEMSSDLGFDDAVIFSILSRVSTATFLPQPIRHRAVKLVRQWSP